MIKVTHRVGLILKAVSAMTSPSLWGPGKLGLGLNVMGVSRPDGKASDLVQGSPSASCRLPFLQSPAEGQLAGLSPPHGTALPGPQSCCPIPSGCVMPFSKASPGPPFPMPSLPGHLSHMAFPQHLQPWSCKNR